MPLSWKRKNRKMVQNDVLIDQMSLPRNQDFPFMSLNCDCRGAVVVIIIFPPTRPDFSALLCKNWKIKEYSLVIKPVQTQKCSLSIPIPPFWPLDSLFFLSLFSITRRYTVRSLLLIMLFSLSMLPRVSCCSCTVFFRVSSDARYGRSLFSSKHRVSW